MGKVIRVCPAGHVQQGWATDDSDHSVYRRCGAIVGLKRSQSDPEASLCTRRAYMMTDAVQAAFRLGGMEAVEALVGSDRLHWGGRTELVHGEYDIDDKIGFALLHGPRYTVRAFGRGVVEKAQAELRKLWKTYWEIKCKGTAL